MRGKLMAGIAAVSLLMAGSVYAQEQPPSADDMVTKMQSQLNLTPDQVNAVKPIVAENMAKRQELRQSMENGGDKDAMHGQMEQLKADEDQKLGKVLTSEQVDQWKAMRSQMHQGGHKRGMRGSS